jgi:hypothetical protein
MQQDADPSTRPEQPPDSTCTINHVGIRVLPFWPEKPAVWFTQLEGQFALSNITQDTTKFHYIISKLDNKYAAEVEDITTNPPPTGCYERIIAEITTASFYNLHKKGHLITIKQRKSLRQMFTTTAVQRIPNIFSTGTSTVYSISGCKDIPMNDIKAYGGVEVYHHAFLTSALDGGEWSTSSLATLHLVKGQMVANE